MAPPSSGTLPASSANVTTDSVMNTKASFAQAMACATVESVTAGMNGLGMPVRSGLGDWRASEGSTGTAKGLLLTSGHVLEEDTGFTNTTA